MEERKCELGTDEARERHNCHPSPLRAMQGDGIVGPSGATRPPHPHPERSCLAGATLVLVQGGVPSNSGSIFPHSSSGPDRHTNTARSLGRNLKPGRGALWSQPGRVHLPWRGCGWHS